MVGLLAIGFVLVNVLGKGSPKVSQQEAVAIARPYVHFDPQGHQIRFIHQGIPPRGTWVVSFYVPKVGGGYEHVTVVVVDAATGQVTSVNRTE